MTDEEWERIKVSFPERTIHTKGRPSNDIRTTLNGISWIARSGKNTKIHAVVDALGNPVYVQLSAGNLHDVTLAEEVLSPVPIKGSIVMADKAYGSKTLRESIEASGASYCILPKSNEKNPWECDWRQYKERHGVECFFGKLKQFRRIATRYDKLAKRFLAFAPIACISILLKCFSLEFIFMYHFRFFQHALNKFTFPVRALVDFYWDNPSRFNSDIEHTHALLEEVKEPYKDFYALKPKTALKNAFAH